MKDSISHVPNRLGRTPLHVCADPPYSKLHKEHQAVITCLVDEFGVEARLKDMYVAHYKPLVAVCGIGQTTCLTPQGTGSTAAMATLRSSR